MPWFWAPHLFRERPGSDWCGKGGGGKAGSKSVVTTAKGKAKCPNKSQKAEWSLQVGSFQTPAYQACGT